MWPPVSCAGDAGNNLGIAINEFKEPRLFERREVVGMVRTGQLRKVADRIFPFRPLNEMSGSREHRSQTAILVTARCAAGMVKMQMGQDYPVNLVRA